jgi:hypothetical protein
VVTRITALPSSSRPIENSRLAAMIAGRTAPTRAKDSGDARRTRRFSSSAGVALTTGMWATSGSFSPDLISILPKPRAKAWLLPSANAKASVSRCFCDILASPQSGTGRSGRNSHKPRNDLTTRT